MKKNIIAIVVAGLALAGSLNHYNRPVEKYSHMCSFSFT